ncbi:hypothetical protein EYF80_028866 [Liparis tanakae]|uniref:Uncharacterized protein n=1 Tax=Liparis tanakae TaxID=230148 RepID=A0A4Z2H5G3_9TELE|nr:hypothetical protein EYF80_028866 [Liparis tanakae]
MHTTSELGDSYPCLQRILQRVPITFLYNQDNKRLQRTLGATSPRMKQAEQNSGFLFPGHTGRTLRRIPALELNFLSLKHDSINVRDSVSMKARMTSCIGSSSFITLVDCLIFLKFLLGGSCFCVTVLPICL